MTISYLIITYLLCLFAGTVFGCALRQWWDGSAERPKRKPRIAVVQGQRWKMPGGQIVIVEYADAFTVHLMHPSWESPTKTTRNRLQKFGHLVETPDD